MRLVLAGFALAATLAACGGSGGGAAVPPVTPAPPPVQAPCVGFSLPGAPGLAYLAGKLGGNPAADGPLQYAGFDALQSMVRDTAGALWFVDGSLTPRLRRLGTDNVLHTIGQLALPPDSPAPRLAAGADGKLYLQNNGAVYRLAADGGLTLLAGNDGDTASSVDGAGTAARLRAVLGFSVDASGTITLVEGAPYAIRRISAAGVVSTVATLDPGRAVVRAAIGPGGDAVYLYGSGGAVEWRAGTLTPLTDQLTMGMGIGADGVAYLATPGQVLRREPGKAPVPLAGAAAQYGLADGAGAAAQFGPVFQDLVADGAGAVTLFDLQAQALRQVTATGVVTTLPSGLPPAPLPAEGMASDCSGHLVVTDKFAYQLDTVDAAGAVHVLAGAADTGTANPPVYPDGPLAAARFYRPDALASDSHGNLYVGEEAVIRKIAPDGTVSILAGSRSDQQVVDGPAATARFGQIAALAAGPDGSLYVLDARRVRRVAPDGRVTTLAGRAPSSFYGEAVDGTGAAAEFRAPSALAVDAAGNVYVTEGNYWVKPTTASFGSIRKVTPAGVVTTVAGGAAGFADGPAASARFANPDGLAFDGAGNLYIADAGNNAIRKLTPAGTVSTVLGAPDRAGFFPGPLAGAGVQAPGRLLWADGALLIRTRQGLVAARGL